LEAGIRERQVRGISKIIQFFGSSQSVPANCRHTISETVRPQAVVRPAKFSFGPSACLLSSLPWAHLWKKRVVHIYMERGPMCGANLKSIAVIEEAGLIEHILT
jgi:hypothetical protein